MFFVHTADNHIDMPLSYLSGQKASARKRSRRLSFSRIINYTLENKADFLLISGDLLHSASSPQAVKFCSEEFARLGDKPVFISLGNHDYLLDTSHFPGNVHVFPGEFETVFAHDYSVTGVSFTSASASFSHKIPPAPDKNKINILLMHGDLFTQSEYNPLNKDFISKLGYDYVALGHIHQYHKIQNIAYPGCHDGGGFDELGPKGFISGNISKGFLSTEFIPSSSQVYEIIDFDISDKTSTSSIADALYDEISENGIYKINLTGTIKEDFYPNISLISDILSQKAFFVKITNKTQADKNLAESNLFNYFTEYIFKNCDDEIASLALQLGINALKGDVRDI